MSEAFAMKELLIYKSTDSTGDNWELQEPKDIPLWLSGNPDIVGHLEAGMGAQGVGEECWYMAMPLHAEPQKILTGTSWRQ